MLRPRWTPSFRQDYLSVRVRFRLRLKSQKTADGRSTAGSISVSAAAVGPTMAAERTLPVASMAGTQQYLPQSKDAVYLFGCVSYILFCRHGGLGLLDALLSPLLLTRHVFCRRSCGYPATSAFAAGPRPERRRRWWRERRRYQALGAGAASRPGQLETEHSFEERQQVRLPQNTPIYGRTRQMHVTVSDMSLTTRCSRCGTNLQRND